MSRSLASSWVAALSLTWAVCAVLAQPSTDVPAPSSPWVGVWALHEPDHGSYVANELRFYPDGRLARTAMIDTNASAARPPRVLGIVVTGRRSCRLGQRWRAHPSPHRVVVEGVCSDGRSRDVTLSLPRGVFERPHPRGTLRAERAGRRRARLGASYRQELVRCNTDPEGPCFMFEQDARTVRVDANP